MAPYLFAGAAFLWALCAVYYSREDVLATQDDIAQGGETEMLSGRLKQNAVLDEDGGARSSSQLVCCSPRWLTAAVDEDGLSGCVGGVMGRTSLRKLSLAQFCKNRCVEQLIMGSHPCLENELDLKESYTALLHFKEGIVVSLPMIGLYIG
ncbi:hypothetical protein QQF64_005947 [Cirrhinus molitorella]|uniref:Uncharacterized protein n=1 Tax=Cirrhinus molitorella TaxID=172907 RepID=A0ABR3MHL9_9TELE